MPSACNVKLIFKFRTWIPNMYTINILQRNVAPLGNAMYANINLQMLRSLPHNYFVSESWSRLVCYLKAWFIYDTKIS